MADSFLRFPKDFLWGAALSAYQSEGGNAVCDWYQWEQKRRLVPAGNACRHYDFFESDFDIAAQLHLGAVRISIEWARVCPREGYIERSVVEHYRAVCRALRARHIKPLITLHHFTNPLWVSPLKGWESSRVIDAFLFFVRAVVAALREYTDMWLVINEPEVYVYNGYIAGIWPPGCTNIGTAWRVLRNMLAASCAAYREIKSIYCGEMVQVSMPHHMRYFRQCPVSNFGQNALAAWCNNMVFNRYPLDYLARRQAIDCVAVNYYCNSFSAFKNFLPGECSCASHGLHKNTLGWHVDAQGLYQVLTQACSYGLPVYITENGTTEHADALYKEYLVRHIQAIHRALTQGCDIRGYLWWALLDNFEWDNGYGPRFGLTHVDYTTQERRIKPFAQEYAKICKENGISINA